MLVTAEPATDDVAAHRQYARSVTAARASGTVATLTVALANLAIVEFTMGSWPAAATEALQLATDTGQPAMAAYLLVLLATIALLHGRTSTLHPAGRTPLPGADHPRPGRRATLRRRPGHRGRRAASRRRHRPPAQPHHLAAAHPPGRVARLAGQGLTNRQIADRLFVSTHTVGSHLHKVYGKLGISSRAELGRLALDDDTAG